MRIGFFVSGFPMRSETFILTQIGGLLERGHDVQIWANEIHDPSSLHSDFLRYGLFERVRRRRHVSGGTLVRRILARLRLLAPQVLRQPRLAARALNVFRYGKKALSLDLLDMALCFSERADYDVVHCHFGPNGNDAALLMELGVLRGKLVTTFHSYDVLTGMRDGGKAYRRLVARADAVHSISDYNRRWLEAFRFAPERIHYQPMAIDLKRFPTRVRRNRETLRIVTVARLAPEKGLRFALQAIAGLRSERPDLRLRYEVIGDGPLSGELRAYTETLALDDVVEFLGPRDQAFVRSVLIESDIFLLASLQEALPIAIMEALASKLPVVATDVGSVAELVHEGETGRLVRAADADALEAGLRGLIDAGDEERRKMGERGHALVAARHDTSIVTDRLIEHYRALVRYGQTTRGSQREPLAFSRP